MPSKKAAAPRQASPSLKEKRRLQPPEYKSLRLHKRLKHPGQVLPSSWQLLVRAVKQLGINWKVFTGILIIYSLLTLVLVRGFGVNSALPQTKELLQGLFHGIRGELNSGITLFGVLLGSNTTAGQSAAAYQSILVIITSLAIIWGLRQSFTDTRMRVRDTFYKGMAPLVPFMLVLMVIGLELFPILLASLLYNFIFNNGIAVTVIEKILWGALMFLLTLLSLYMVTSSIFALYIVTLPNVAPLQALRSARGLVLFRRWTVMRKVIFLPIMLLILAAVILIPVILYATVVAEWLYFLLTMLALIVLHAYMYTLYRELIV